MMAGCKHENVGEKYCRGCMQEFIDTSVEQAVKKEERKQEDLEAILEAADSVLCSRILFFLNSNEPKIAVMLARFLRMIRNRDMIRIAKFNANIGVNIVDQAKIGDAKMIIDRFIASLPKEN